MTPSDYPQIMLLSGPPCSGKDTVTALLLASDHPFQHLRNYKDSKEGSPHNYRVVTPERFDQMERQDSFVYWHQRYGRRYGLAWDDVDKAAAHNLISITHVGRLSNVLRLQSALSQYRTVSILLWIDRETCLQRLQRRHKENPAEIARRIQAYDEEMADLREAEVWDYDVLIDNSQQNPEACCRQILAELRTYGEGQVQEMRESIRARIA